MPASKGVTIGLSVSAAVGFVTLVVILVLFLTRPKTPGGGSLPPPACGTAPSVDKQGVVANFNNTVMPDNKTCGENLAALDTLCRSTMCTVEPCEGYATWDAYDAQTHACYKASQPTCEQQLCDSTVCLSSSVRAVLPPLHKSVDAAGNCTNPKDSEVAAMCNARNGYQFVYPDCVPTSAAPLIRLTPVTNTTSLLTGILTVPQVDDLIVTYSLSGHTGVMTGPVFLSPPLSTTFCVAGEQCMTYNIHVQPPLRAGSYTLTLHGRPQWSPVRMYTTATPAIISVTAPPVEPDVYPELNPAPTLASAQSVKTQDDLLRTLLAEVALRRQNITMTVSATLSASNLLWLQPSSSETSVLTAACTPDVCGLEGSAVKLMPYALIFMAWPPVAPLDKCAGTVQYDVMCQEEATGSVQTAVLTRSPRPSFADAVRVGETVTYTLVARQGSCKSEPVTIVVYIPPFTDKEVCSKVTLPPPLDLATPSWMWSSPAGCHWLPNYLPAQDVYCLLHNTPSKSVEVNNLVLSDMNNQCRRVEPSYASLTKPFPSPSCDDTLTLKQACFTGLDTGVARTAVCPPELPMADSGARISSVAALVNRLDQAESFLRVHPGLYPAAQIATVAQAREDAPGVYSKCGPATAPTTWGMDSSKCSALDVNCVAAAENAACERNYCDPWKPTPGKPDEFEQTRLCFVSEAVGQTKCCQPGEEYHFDSSQPRGSARGTCKKKLDKT